jgi:pimeloyl-ACP methyl ester carboxylesterase
VNSSVGVGLTAMALLVTSWAPAVPAQASGQIQVLDWQGTSVDRLTDGDTIRIRVTLTQPVSQETPIELHTGGFAPPLAICTIRAAEAGCTTEPLAALGWYWEATGRSSPSRTIEANSGATSIASFTLRVAPRPVVMVHGFASSWQAWVNYLGPSGYLASNGLAGYAVGDGQFPGAMNTGNLSAPNGRTNTIAENAAILGDYIAGVKRATGAQQVDLIAHSMGGLIARYYIDRVMASRDVAQLLMLGSPMAGTDCADLPASLGLYLPASLEIRPAYVEQVFNPQITHRHGVPFHALAGVPIIEGFRSPCTAVPSDLAVSFGSVTAIPLQFSRLPILHMNLNSSADVFHGFVQPLLQTPVGGFTDEPDPAQPSAVGDRLQFSHIFTGHVPAGGSQQVTIPIDPQISVASFALYDTSRSLQVTVRGASGNVIDLSPDGNGLVVVDDPSALFYLGYGFQNPKPGEWNITLLSTSRTPAAGADFALAAHLEGGASIDANLSRLLPQVDQPVDLSVSLNLGGSPLALSEAQAAIRGPDGRLQTLPLTIEGTQARASWKPAAAGLYAIDVSARGLRPDGATVERTAFLSAEAQPAVSIAPQLWLGGALLLIVVGVMLVWSMARRRRKPAAS